jgi:glycosyltransferase involved in cell wall biosynthesis
LYTPNRRCSGLLIPSGKPRALAGAIDRMLGSPDLARRLAQAAHERAKDYDWEVLAAHLRAGEIAYLPSIASGSSSATTARRPLG